MSLRTKILVYLVLIHAVLGSICFIVLRQDRVWLLIVEGLFLLSAVLGVLLVKAFFVPLNLISTGADLLAEQDFTSTFSSVGQPEMDALIEVYNRMVEQLRDERLRAQEQHHFLEKLIAASPTGVLTLDFDDRIADLNPIAAALLDAEPDAARGLALRQLTNELAQSLPELVDGESRVVAVAGPRRVRISRASFYDRGFPRTFFIFEELTSELRATEKAAYDKLVRVMSHEVNNSVAAVNSLLESLAESIDSGTNDVERDLTRTLGVALERLEHLRAFTRGYAEVVRLPAPTPKDCDLPRLIHDLMILHRGEFSDRGIRVTTHLPEDAVVVKVDKNQIEQVLVNVLRNAIEAVDREGSIDIRLEEAVETVILTVDDSGPGIPEEVRSQLFTPFFSTKREGRGIGLTLAQEVLSQHDCRFALRNRVDASGARFEIQFPRPH